MAQRMVHHHQCQKRLSNGCGADTHTWVVAAFGHHLHRMAVLVNRIAWAQDRACRFDGDTHFQVLTRADTAQNTTCMVGGKTLGRQCIAMHGAAVRDACKTRANFYAFDCIQSHHGVSNVGV